ncbi:hypothetical protein IWW38_002994 [Coemansia aciculifera]|uniref:Uncharacterized protein n=1 Tax=Coemansia aciculifera TaxID=417176 RepID=A0ACC1M2I5_9FUNG|nr:hypothetical protein IWW38_002994 [Coemansia aciculifera]
MCNSPIAPAATLADEAGEMQLAEPEEAAVDIEPEEDVVDIVPVSEDEVSKDDTAVAAKEKPEEEISEEDAAAATKDKTESSKNDAAVATKEKPETMKRDADVAQEKPEDEVSEDDAAAATKEKPEPTKRGADVAQEKPEDDEENDTDTTDAVSKEAVASEDKKEDNAPGLGEGGGVSEADISNIEIEKPRVQVYGSTVSGNRTYKRQVKDLFTMLEAQEVDFEYICIAASEPAKKYLRRKALGNMTIPQIYVDGELRGFYDDAFKANEADELYEWLGLDEEPVDY